MKLTFKYNLKELVKIKSLNITGIVTCYFYGETGIQYQVSYFYNGERKSVYLYNEELEHADGWHDIEQQVGFFNKEVEDEAV